MPADIKVPQESGFGLAIIGVGRQIPLPAKRARRAGGLRVHLDPKTKGRCDYQLSTVMALRPAAEVISRQSEMRNGLLPPKSASDSS